MLRKINFVFLALCLCSFVPPPSQTAWAAPGTLAQTQNESISALKAKIERSPKLPFTETHFVIHAPKAGWELGAVSGVAAGSDGTIYLIQRGDKADPIIAVDAKGNVLRSWGKGDFTLPHSIRVDPKGNVWAVDAEASIVIKYSASGTKLMTIAIEKAPKDPIPAQGPFRGATDVAFAPNGHIFITDGYVNARVLEYTANGKRFNSWGKPGSAAGEFHLPHAIQIDNTGTDNTGAVYIADRENGRIESFTRDGRYLQSIDHLGRCYALKLFRGALWATMSPINEDPGAPGWIVKLDPKTGKILGHLDIPDPRQGHAIEILSSGEPLVTSGDGVLWFRSH